jgi:HEAT repeat protein
VLAAATALAPERPVVELLAALAQLAGLRSRRLFAELVVLLRHDDPRVRRGAVRALALHAASRAGAVLLATLDDPDASVRTETIDALALRGSARAVPALCRLLAIPGWTRWQAIRALGQLRAAAALPVLEDLRDRAAPHEQLEIERAVAAIRVKNA